MSKVSVTKEGLKKLKRIQEITKYQTRQKHSLSSILDVILSNTIVTPLNIKSAKRKTRSDKGSKKIINPEYLHVPSGISQHFEDSLKNWCSKYNFYFTDVMQIFVEKIIPLKLKNEPEMAQALMKLSRETFSQKKL